MLGTVPDGVTKFLMTASRGKQEVKRIESMTIQNVFTLGHDGVTIGRHGPITHDGPEENYS